VGLKSKVSQALRFEKNSFVTGGAVEDWERHWYDWFRPQKPHLGRQSSIAKSSTHAYSVVCAAFICRSNASNSCMRLAAANLVKGMGGAWRRQPTDEDPVLFLSRSRPLAMRLER